MTRGAEGACSKYLLLSLFGLRPAHGSAFSCGAKSDWRIPAGTIRSTRVECAFPATSAPSLVNGGVACRQPPFARARDCVACDCFCGYRHCGRCLVSATAEE